MGKFSLPRMAGNAIWISEITNVFLISQLLRIIILQQDEYILTLFIAREGKYLGQCVQIIPHITDAIKNQLRKIASEESLDVMVVECGGPVGDIESLPFLEALRQMELEDGISNTLFIHVTLAPKLDVVGEQKTKPTQHSVQELRRIGIQPDILAVRCKTPLTLEARRKISLFASIKEESVISSHDAPSIYKIPEVLASQGIVKVITNKLLFRNCTSKMGELENNYKILPSI